MNNKTILRPSRPFHIFINFFVVFMLAIIPFPNGIELYIMPDFLILMIIYWVMRQPENLPLWLFFVLGLFVDIIALHRLGVNALTFTLVAYVFHLTQKKMSISSIEKQILFIFFILFGIRLLKAIIAWYISGQIPSVLYFFPVFTTTFLWPIFSKFILHFSLRG